MTTGHSGRSDPGVCYDVLLPKVSLYMRVSFLCACLCVCMDGCVSV